MIGKLSAPLSDPELRVGALRIADTARSLSKKIRNLRSRNGDAHTHGRA